MGITVRDFVNFWVACQNKSAKLPEKLVNSSAAIYSVFIHEKLIPVKICKSSQKLAEENAEI